MTLALWALVGVVVVGMLLRMPIGFSMLMAGVAYLLVKGQLRVGGGTTVCVRGQHHERGHGQWKDF